LHVYQQEKKAYFILGVGGVGQRKMTGANRKGGSGRELFSQKSNNLGKPGKEGTHKNSKKATIIRSIMQVAGREQHLVAWYDRRLEGGAGKVRRRG